MRVIDGAIDQVSQRLAAAGAQLLKYEPKDLTTPEPSKGLQAVPQSPSRKLWPLLQKGNFGILADIADLATRNSEADPIAVMGTVLAFGSAVFGRSRFMSVGDTIHHPRLFCALVGASSRARKGTSIDPVHRIFKATETELQRQTGSSFPSYQSLRISYGPLSSGEGLVDAIRDRSEHGEDTGGTDDKRMLCIEGEFGAVLRAVQRQGNNLSTMLRVAWDGSTMAPLTKNNKVIATDPHICIIAHVTEHELKALLGATDVFNGFANRFLWLAVRRAKLVPFPEPIPEADVARVATELAKCISHAHSRGGDVARLVLSNSAQSHWRDVYPELTLEHGGILGAVTSRAEAQALRLAMTFAMFAGSERIEFEHIESALKFWRYAFDSAGSSSETRSLIPSRRKSCRHLNVGPRPRTSWSTYSTAT